MLWRESPLSTTLYVVPLRPRIAVNHGHHLHFTDEETEARGNLTEAVGLNQRSSLLSQPLGPAENRSNLGSSGLAPPAPPLDPETRQAVTGTLTHFRQQF